MTIFLDLDGVLANYDKAANKVLGTDNHYKYDFIYGAADYWARLHASGDFFLNMEMMPDAQLLLDALLGYKLTVLTALPKTNGEHVEWQKRQWVKRNIGSGMPVICCKTFEKPDHCKPGDILIDDRAVTRDIWQMRGGRYIIHTSALSTIDQLGMLGVGPRA